MSENTNPFENKESLQKAIDELENLKRLQSKSQREINTHLYQEYIKQQEDYFVKILDFINSHIIELLNASGGVIVEPLRLEARIKSLDSSLANDAKARDPRLGPRKEDEEPEKSSDLSDIFGLTLIYTGDEIDSKELRKFQKTGKPYKKPEENLKIEKAIADRFSDFFVIHENRLESKRDKDFPNLKRISNPNTGYDSLHGTAYLKPEWSASILGTSDPNMMKMFQECIPMIEFHITEASIHRKAALDAYHIFKFANPVDRSDFNSAKRKNDKETMDEITKKVKKDLQAKFDQVGYDFISDDALPRMFYLSDEGEIKERPKGGNKGIIKHLFPWLDITQKEKSFKERIMAAGAVSSDVALSRLSEKMLNSSDVTLVDKLHE